MRLLYGRGTHPIIEFTRHAQRHVIRLDMRDYFSGRCIDVGSVVIDLYDRGGHDLIDSIPAFKLEESGAVWFNFIGSKLLGLPQGEYEGRVIINTSDRGYKVYDTLVFRLKDEDKTIIYQSFLSITPLPSDQFTVGDRFSVKLNYIRRVKEDIFIGDRLSIQVTKVLKDGIIFSDGIQKTEESILFNEGLFNEIGFGG